ncbi:MAG: mannose-1-phosphate guanylyltransferase/mannose-6-phosphate isomerase [Pseudomonadota bacterium]
MHIHPVILSGGSGTRLWPLSRAALPKQLLPLVSDRTMLQETVLRLSGIADVTSPTLVCNQEHRFMVAEQMRAIDVGPEAIFLEPVGRNTAPAAAVAALALMAKDAEALMLLLPADHLIGDVKAFERAVAQAAAIAQSGQLVTFGIVPLAPETGYGYIQRGIKLGDMDNIFAVERFVEKPSREIAQGYLESGDYFWNSGMFLFKAAAFIEELRKYHPDILAASQTALDHCQRDLDFVRLDTEAFTACPSESIDYAVMERTKNAVVVPADIAWSDIGSWSALWEVGEKDPAGNVLRGDIYSDDASNNLIRAESRMVVAIGVSDLVIVETSDAIMVAHKDRVQDVKKAVEYLKQNNRTEHLNHTRVFRPWGWYEGIDAGDRFQVKRIMVKPGEKLSLQMHHHRAEHWIVVSGTARVTRNDEVLLLTENQSTYIPLGSTHRLENAGKIPLHMIEVQSGAYLGEDDIVRFEDIYQRS